MFIDLQSTKPCFGDHLLITINVIRDRNNVESTFRRDYSKEHLLGELAIVDWPLDILDVQSFWNSFESKVISIVDKIVPVTEFVNNRVLSKPPPVIRNKINKRNRLLKRRKHNMSETLRRKIVDLNAEIKTFYFSKKKESVRKGILPGNSRSLWSAVNIAKDTGTDEIPKNIFMAE